MKLIFLKKLFRNYSRFPVRILVIEDDPTTQYSSNIAVKEKLTSLLGYQPFVVKLGKEDLEAAKVQSFDFIY